MNLLLRKENSKTKKKKRKKQVKCDLKGHLHKWINCPNNPKSKLYCGVHYDVVREQEREREEKEKQEEEKRSKRIVAKVYETPETMDRLL